MHDNLNSENSNSDNSNSLKLIIGPQLKKIDNIYVGLINTYKPFFSFCKISNILLDLAKMSFKVYFFFYFWYFEKQLKFYKKIKMAYWYLYDLQTILS